MIFDYYYGLDAEQFAFYRIPKLLFLEDVFAGLSVEAKVLYGILLDRMQLSARNNWLDEEGRVYIVFTIEQIQEAMGCGNKKAIKLLDELEHEAHLIIRKRYGMGKPNRIYVMNFITGVSNGHFKKCQNDISRSVEMTFQEVSKRHCSNTNTSNTDLSNTEYSESAELSDTDYEELVEEFGKEEVDYQIQKIKIKHYKGCMNKTTIGKWCKERQVTVPQLKKKNKFTDFPQRHYSKQEMDDLEKRLLERTYGRLGEGEP